MENEKLEFFKLDETDRKVLLWLMDHHQKSIKSWIEYVANDYKRRNGIDINIDKFYKETQG